MVNLRVLAISAC